MKNHLTVVAQLLGHRENKSGRVSLRRQARSKVAGSHRIFLFFS